MKKSIYINQDTLDKKGGGANFISFLKNKLKTKYQIKSDSLSSEIFLLNSFPFNSPFSFLKALLIGFIQNKIIIYRVDGPISVYRRKPEDLIIDKFIEVVISLSDHVIFQSVWSYNYMSKLCNIDKNKKYSIIHNSYLPNQKRLINNSKEIKVLISTWSKNWIKGFEVYQYIDSILDQFSNIKIDFIGRSPIDFKNINYLGEMSNQKLINEYKNYDIFFTASLFDPCSNSLAEAKSNGCMIIARNNGGHPELIGNYDLLFSNQNELFNIFSNLEVHLNKFNKKFSLNLKKENYSLNKYIEIFENIEKKNYFNYLNNLKLFLFQYSKLILFYLGYKLSFSFGLSLLKREYLLKFKNDFNSNNIKKFDYQEIINKIPHFIESMHSEDNSDLYRMSFSSDIYRKSLLVPQLYVLKLLKILSVNNKFQKENLIKLILDKFLLCEGNFIYISDVAHLKRITLKSRIKKYLNSELYNYYNQCYRADTRQAISSLLECNYDCEDIIEITYPKSIEYYLFELENFSKLQNLNIAWHELSHLSHLLFEISLTHSNSFKWSANHKKYLNKLSYTFNKFVHQIYLSSDFNSKKNQEKIKYLINGLMKLFSGFNRIKYIPNFSFDKIIEIIFRYNSQTNACDFLNTAYVLNYCVENAEKQQNEKILVYMDKLLNVILNKYYFYDLGGFSFYENSCQYAIYNSYVAKRTKEPDMHGTLLFTWFLSLYGKITNNNIFNKLNVLTT